VGDRERLLLGLLTLAAMLAAFMVGLDATRP
jgi:hypothetical protein